MVDGEVLAVLQDMTISRDAFVRSLPAAVNNVGFEVTSDGFRYREGDRMWRIVLTALPDLKLGMITLPRQRVAVFLTGYDPTAVRSFVDRFELYFRRAGG